MKDVCRVRGKVFRHERVFKTEFLSHMTVFFWLINLKEEGEKREKLVRE